MHGQSPQSQILKDRAELDSIDKEFEAKFKDVTDEDIPCPEYLGWSQDSSIRN